MDDIKLNIVEVATKSGLQEIVFTSDYSLVRLADVVSATGVKAGYSVATALDELGHGISEVVKDTKTRHHKYINVKEVIRLWAIEEENIIKTIPASTYRNCKSFMAKFTDMMEEIIEENDDHHIPVVEVDGGEADEADFGISVDIILAELDKIEKMRKGGSAQEERIAELIKRNSELEKEMIENKKKYNDMVIGADANSKKHEARFDELKSRYDEISKQRDDLIKKNAEIVSKNTRLIKALTVD
ncbi:MAG: hypothetical protein ACRCZ0_00200 [Cetobacterium sp.]